MSKEERRRIREAEIAVELQRRIVEDRQREEEWRREEFARQERDRLTNEWEWRSYNHWFPIFERLRYRPNDYTQDDRNRLREQFREEEEQYWQNIQQTYNI